MRPHDLLKRPCRVMTLAALGLTLSLALLGGCGDALQGSWEKTLTCADMKGPSYGTTYHCNPGLSVYDGSWSQTIKLRFEGDTFEYEQQTKGDVPTAQLGFYAYDEAAGILQLRYCANGDGCVGGWERDNPALTREDWQVSLSPDGEQLVARAGRDAFVMTSALAWEGWPLTLARR